MKLILIFLLSFIVNAQTYKISPDSLEENNFTLDNWKYSQDDSSAFANSNYNDSSWQIVKSRFRQGDLSWNGVGWFRSKLEIDSSLLNKPLGFLLWHPGKSEIYLNGELLYKTDQEDYENRVFIKYPAPIYFSELNNVIAIRYTIEDFERLEKHNFYSGFYLRVDNYLELLTDRINNVLNPPYKLIIFATIGFLLLLIHLSLFFFNRTFIQNFYYSLFLVSFIIFIYINYSSTTSLIQSDVIELRSFGLFPLILTIFFGSVTIHSIYEKINFKTFSILLAIGLIIGAVRVFLVSNVVWYAAYGYIILVSIWGSHYLYEPKRKKELGGDWILIVGFASLGILGFYQMIVALQIIQKPLFDIYDPFIYGILLFLLSMSISLSRDFAATNKNLIRKLVEVKELSDKNIQQEIERKILEKDNERKTKELEEARQFQLSLLPNELPKLNNVEVYAQMVTATEVGGDYYDYFLKESKLTLVIGDATGHGTKAGNMVVAIKSLFSSIDKDFDQVSFFNKCNSIIKNMHMDKMFMSLTLINIEGSDVSISSAGMPQAIYYNSQTKSIREILLKGMPIGAVNNFPYSVDKFSANKNDILLLLTDGILEQFNIKKEMFGIERVKNILTNSATENPNKIFEMLLSEVNTWRKEEPQNDDITFMIIKFV